MTAFWTLGLKDMVENLGFFSLKFHLFLSEVFVFLCWNDAAEDRCLHTHRLEMFRYIYLCNMKYIAQSVPIFTTADLIEYHCFFWSSSFPLDLFHFIKLLLCSILEYAYKHYSYCFHIASSSCTANLTYLTLIQAKLNHQWCYTHTHTKEFNNIYLANV